VQHFKGLVVPAWMASPFPFWIGFGDEQPDDSYAQKNGSSIAVEEPSHFEPTATWLRRSHIRCLALVA